MGNRNHKNKLYNDLITLNFINANEKWITPVKRHWNIEKKTTEINHMVYFKDALTSEWKQEYYIEEGILLFFPKEEKFYACHQNWKRFDLTKRHLLIRRDDSSSSIMAI